MTQKPALSFWQIWNMCIGFMGIQFGFELQVSNVSRIFQTLGANIDEIAILWVAAPLTGLIVQPIIGYMSDKTWTRLGRRRPYFFYGAILSTLALLIMPNSPTLWIAAGMLWIMDASFNIAMEPFRAFVGDMLPNRQRSLGYAMQTFFIGIGASVAAALPWIMTNAFGVANEADPGIIPDSVIYAFYTGGIFLLICVFWTVFTTKEYSPEELDAFNKADHAASETSKAQAAAHDETLIAPARHKQGGMLWLAVGVAASLVIYMTAASYRLHILSGGVIVFGLLRLIVSAKKDKGQTASAIVEITDDLMLMPTVMKQLAVVQFFSWFAMFAMWSFTTPAVTAFHFGAMDPSSEIYNTGANWAGVLNSVRNLVTIAAAIFIALYANTIGRRKIHMLNLTLGGIGLASFYVVKDPDLLVISMGLVGFAWASILSIPYSLLSSAVAHHKMGIYMGIFNFFIVIPQIVASTTLGLLVSELFAGQAIYGLVFAGGSMIIAALATLNVSEPEAE
ncbi:MFS transporter [Kordiimonas lipolytica]|uniref:MFS transporter n=2 Tax=Kordiimonas lipolytica TaxID=1662421 RepID=A0ABV8U8M1_9PROT